MPKIVSQLDTNSNEYKEKKKSYEELIKELQEKLSSASITSKQSAIKTARERNKYLAEERIEALVDPGSPLLDIASLAGDGMYEDVPAGAGVRCCIANVASRLCMIVANNPAIKGGTYFPMSVKKHLRAQQIALENRLPCIYSVDSGGAFLPLQSEVFPDREHFGRIFFNQAMMSSRGIPQLSLVLGSCTAGGAYVPAMSDETIMVKGNATIFLGGPPLVKAATGETVSAEELGGAEVHCRKSGVADRMVETESEGFVMTRSLIANLGPEHHSIKRVLPEQDVEEPAYDAAEIYGIVGTHLNKTFPVMEVIARLVDGSRFDEFKADFGSSVKCGFAHIHGMRVGIIANDGILFSESALKATHFIELCDQRLTPIVFLQNIAGFMVGKNYEHEGIAKHGAKMVTAVATCRVPKLTLIIGGSFGAGNYAMCGRAYDPRFLFTWPNSRISVMGGEQAANVLSQIKFGDKNSKEKKSHQAAIAQKYEAEGSPYYASARLWDDGIIDPRSTRMTLALALASSLIEPVQQERFGMFRM